jgi:thymidylate kinase
MAQILCLEGTAGVGKTTQIVLLQTHFSKLGLKTIAINEKDYQPFGSFVRAWHKESKQELTFNLEQIIAFAEARGITHREELLPTLSKYDIAIFDRCYLTSSVHQANDQINSNEIIEVNLSRGAIPIDLGFILQCDPIISTQRVKERALRKNTNYEHPSLHEELPEAIRFNRMYRELVSTYPNFRLIDASGSPEDTFNQIISAFQWEA